MAENKTTKKNGDVVTETPKPGVKVTYKTKKNPVKKQVNGFMDFVRTQGVVGLAIGLAIGTQATILVKSIVDNFITPLVGLLIGKQSLENWVWTVHIGNRSATFNMGAIVNALINFLAVAFVVYFVIKGLKLDKLDKPKESS